MAQLRIDRTDQGINAVCSGRWTAVELEDAAIAASELAGMSAAQVTVDLSGIEQIDTAGALLLQQMQDALTGKGKEIRMSGGGAATDRVLEMTARYRHEGASFGEAPSGMLETVGRWTVEQVRSNAGIFAFTGQVFLTFMNMLLFKTQWRMRETVHQMMESAIKALGIIALTMFLVGVVVAYQSAVQLKTYGANIFIVDALGISILRELAPMLTAIVVAGRSGSSYAAQIGVMKMTEEIDAMRTMGFDPFAFLVLPRLFALMIMMPILIFFADFFGMLGGMVIANTDLGLSVTMFLDRFVNAVALKHFWIGEIKGPFFAVLIASIGIYRGLQVKNDTESIGINTTRSVVESIFAVIICDAIFSIVFTKLGY